MFWISNKYFWFPFYGILLFFLIWHYKWQSIPVILSIVLVIVLADQFTSSFMKPFFGRLRPCHDPDMMFSIHLIGSCGGRFGFASAHAANSFGLATFCYLLMHKQFIKTGYFFVWALLVSYSRIYLGVHYLADVLIGAALGVLFALIIFRIFRYFQLRIWPKESPRQTIPK